MLQEPPVPPTTVVPKEKPQAPLWKRTLKVIVIILFLLVGTLAASAQPNNGVYYRNGGEVVQAVIIGTLVALLALAVVGSIGHAIAKRRGSQRRWRASVTTFPVLLITLLILVLAEGGRAVQEQQAIRTAQANPNGTLAAREKAALEVHDWGLSRAPLLRAARTTLRRNATLLSTLNSYGNGSRLRVLANDIEREFQSEQGRLAALPPAPFADLRRVDGQVAHMLSLFHSAYSSYIAGLKVNLASGLPLPKDQPAGALLRRGDSQLNAGVALLNGLRPTLVAIDHRYGIR